MISVIDHRVRTQLNISSVHYLIAHTCAQHEPLWKRTGVQELADALGLSSRAVSVAMQEMITSKPALLEKAENGAYYPTKHWHMAHDGEAIVLTNEHEEIAKEVIMFFNQINDTKYQIPANIDLVKRILKANPKLKLDHFKSVIVHKRETWGAEDKMREYNRPATLFSGKFLKYLDDANHYWINKEKHDSTTTLHGD